LMNQLWVRISLTFVAIVIFLIIVPSVIYLTIQADEINLSYSDGIHSDQPPEGDRITKVNLFLGWSAFSCQYPFWVSWWE